MKYHAFSFILLAGTLLSGCASVQPVAVTENRELGINVSTPAQRVERPSRDSARDKVMTLEELREARGNPAPSGSSADRLTAPALRDNALRYGTQGGLAWGTRQIQQLLRERSTELGRTYDFNSLAIRSRGSNAVLLPPVISEMINPAEIQDGGRTLRAADRYYEIIQQQRLVERAPLWQSYIDMEACCSKSPEEPSDPLPKTSAERDMWRKYVTEGWNEGLAQAREIFESNMRRLQRDFTGMARYMKLVEEGKATAPAIADASLGTTGTGQNMRTNDTVTKITHDAHLNVGSGRDWRPAVGGAPVGEGAVPAGEIQPQPRTEEAGRGGRIVPASRPGRYVSPSARGTTVSSVPTTSAAGYSMQPVPVTTPHHEDVPAISGNGN